MEAPQLESTSPYAQHERNAHASGWCFVVVLVVVCTCVYTLHIVLRTYLFKTSSVYDAYLCLYLTMHDAYC